MDESYVEKFLHKENLCERAEVLMAVPKGREDGMACCELTYKGKINGRNVVEEEALECFVVVEPNSVGVRISGLIGTF